MNCVKLLRDNKQPVLTLLPNPLIELLASQLADQIIQDANSDTLPEKIKTRTIKLVN